MVSYRVYYCSLILPDRLIHALYNSRVVHEFTHYKFAQLLQIYLRNFKFTKNQRFYPINSLIIDEIDIRFSGLLPLIQSISIKYGIIIVNNDISSSNNVLLGVQKYTFVFPFFIVKFARKNIIRTVLEFVHVRYAKMSIARISILLRYYTPYFNVKGYWSPCI